MEQFFKRLVIYYLTMNLQKFELVADQLAYLGYEISTEEVGSGADEAKLISVAKAPAKEMLECAFLIMFFYILVCTSCQSPLVFA